MDISVYTDASYCHKTKIAACGYCILKYGEFLFHEVVLYSDVLSSTQAESLAISAGLQKAFLINDVKSISVNSDCITLSDKYKRTRNKTQYKEMKEVIAIIKEHKIGISINFLRGHNGHTYNEFIDKSCKLNLRNYLKQSK